MGRVLHIERLDPPTHPTLARAVQAMAATAPFDLYVYEGYRSFARSDALYEQGRTKPGPVVTNAKGGESPHNFGLAVDLYPSLGGQSVEDANAPEWEELGRLAESNGLVWGGHFRLKDGPDKPHVELPDWRLLRDRFFLGYGPKPNA